MDRLATNISAIVSGKYIVAVSGGVDSVVLLDLLVKNKNLDLVVAHFDHGMRDDSHQDRLFVQELASKYGLKFEYDTGKLGPHTSEDTARQKRYKFLQKMSKKYSAKIITAHHRDDVIETMIINLLRGTDRRGLTSLRSTEAILRPLLNVTKTQIVKYAEENNLRWHEDITNKDEKILRNYVRNILIPKMLNEDTHASDKLFAIYKNMIDINKNIDFELKNLTNQLSRIKDSQITLSRYVIVMLPISVTKELVYLYLKELSGDLYFSRKQVTRVVNFAKIAKPGKRMIVSKKVQVIIKPGKVCLAKVD